MTSLSLGCFIRKFFATIIFLYSIIQAKTLDLLVIPNNFKYLAPRVRQLVDEPELYPATSHPQITHDSTICSCPEPDRLS